MFILGLVIGFVSGVLFSGWLMSDDKPNLNDPRSIDRINNRTHPPSEYKKDK